MRTTREAAELELVKHRAALEAGRPDVNSRMTVGSWLTRWSRSLSGNPRTIEAYTYNVERFLIPELGHIKLRDLRRIHVEESLAAMARYRKQRGSGRVSAGTILAARRTLRVALTEAELDGLIASNPAAGRLRNAPRVSVDKLYPSPAEAEAILDELRDDPLYPMFLLMRWTGARSGEVRGLRPRDVDRARALVTFSRQPDDSGLKRDSSRRALPIPDAVCDELARMPARSLAHVFTTRTGQPIDSRRALRVMEQACERLELPHYTPHSFRHAFAAELLGARLPDSYVMRLLGHTSIATTVHEYGHLKPTRGATHTPLSDYWSPAGTMAEALELGH